MSSDLDLEEQAILDAYHAGTLQRSPLASSEIQILTDAAQKYNAAKSCSITLRISPHDLSRLKKRAAKRGMKYQTLLTALTRQFLDEEIELKL